jgi:hypothetical protein
MSKRNRTNTSWTIERRLAEGRGSDYKPWIEIHDLASRGQANRVKSHLNSRTCHMHSQLETDWFYAFHALPSLKDLREQYPLLELQETLGIAEGLDVQHPTDPKSLEPCMATTDFLLTFDGGLREVDMAISIKPAADLTSKRVLEKLEIERVYWSARKIDWRILTDKELPRALVKNMRWLHPHLNLPETGDFKPELISRVRTVMELGITDGKNSLVAVANHCDDRLGLAPGAALCVARHLIGIGVWPVDLMIEIDPRKPLQLLTKGAVNVTLDQLAA